MYKSDQLCVPPETCEQLGQLKSEMDNNERGIRFYSPGAKVYCLESVKDGQINRRITMKGITRSSRLDTQLTGAVFETLIESCLHSSEIECDDVEWRSSDELMFRQTKLHRDHLSDFLRQRDYAKVLRATNSKKKVLSDYSSEPWGLIVSLKH